MKKLLSAVLALTMLLLTACGSGAGNAATDESTDNSVTETPYEGSSIYETIVGIPGDKILMTVDGNPVPAAMYFYWTLSSTQELLSQLQMFAMYYGAHTEAFNADGTINWAYELSEDYSIAVMAETQTRSMAAYYATIENMAKELGVTITDEDRAAMEEQMDETLESYRAQLAATDPSAETMAAKELMQLYLDAIGLDAALLERINSVYYLYQHLNELVLTEGSDIYLSDDYCNEYGYYADHILISTIDTTTREPLSEEEIAQKTALANDIIAQLENGNYSIELFNSLADQYSEDPGRQTNPTGYIFSPGDMVTEFENATAALTYGQISGLVESDFGYHIILRKDIAEGLALYPEEKAAFIEEHLGSLISLNMFDSEVVYDEALTGFDYGKFFEDYNAYMSTLTEAGTATE